jgi:hypothetical protein
LWSICNAAVFSICTLMQDLLHLNWYVWWPPILRNNIIKWYALRTGAEHVERPILNKQSIVSCDHFCCVLKMTVEYKILALS